ncbi:ABC transporter substrate-binding protein [Nocardia sp.]|uniref:ABC transporter substrate-binding protein n=1 Tax=Nocardia sp. TaxID=1821 RepID=UPI00258E94EC|nr:ABC transporter substrate-binding protein [Nocardia sp.]
MKVNRRLVILSVVALVSLSGCARTGTEEARGPVAATSPAVAAEFGDLGTVCGKGSPKSAPAQGVTADTISLGVFTDLGFTKNPEFIEASEVFASWCNAHGGIAGRKIELNIHDTNSTEVRQRMREACRDDFALVGGGTGMDALGVKDRLECLLPSFPAQVAQIGSVASDLEISASPTTLPFHDIETGFRRWLVTEGYPESIGAIGMVDADSPVIKAFADKAQESFESIGAKIVYRDRYPVAGVSDWTPFAHAIKEKQVRGLIFNGQPSQLPKLEDALTSIGYRPDWIDAKNNNYRPGFLREAGRSIEFQNNVVDLNGVAPFEGADDVPALRHIQAMFAEYGKSAEITFPQLRSMSAWLLFAKSAAGCGDNLTRRCVYDAALRHTAWTAGGLHAPVDVSDREEPIQCFNVERATATGWVSVPLGTDGQLYRCGIAHYRFTKDYGVPATLADVGKSMADLE